MSKPVDFARNTLFPWRFPAFPKYSFNPAMYRTSIVDMGNRARPYESETTFCRLPWVYSMHDCRLFTLLGMHESSHSFGNICPFHRQLRSRNVPPRSAGTLVTFSGIITEWARSFRLLTSCSVLFDRCLSYFFTCSPRDRGPNLYLVALLMPHLRKKTWWQGKKRDLRVRPVHLCGENGWLGSITSLFNGHQRNLRGFVLFHAQCVIGSKLDGPQFSRKW
jgi:hypothetical protein